MATTWTSSPTIPTHTELQTFSGWQCDANSDTGGDVIQYFLSEDNILPAGLTLSNFGYISGIVLDMDLYVPEFEKPDGFKFNESNYASYGSAKVGSYTFNFSIDAIATGGGETASPQMHNITIRNNWSSDRDEFIREVDQNFAVEGHPVPNEEYLAAMKSRGYFTN